MEIEKSSLLTPEQLEYGLVHDGLDRAALDTLISTHVHENENIDTLVNFFLQYLPGNRSMTEFINRIRQYNSAQICGLVWNANVIAYRCKTCSISPCMSICAQCFQNSNHEGHNYNMFKSQAGGACDCGDSSVMDESGFCHFHGQNRPAIQAVPREIICCAELLIPHLLRVFVRALRISTISGDFITEQKLLEILTQLSNAGSAVQIYLTQTLTDENLYKDFTTDPSMVRLYHHEYCSTEHSTLPSSYFVESLTPDTDGNSLVPFDIELRTMLDEIMMWCVNARLPEDLVRFLLSLLPDLNFKLRFTETFLQFYGAISQSLMEESLSDGSDIPSRLVHISVQLFSSHMIVESAMEKYHLIEVILSSLWRIFVPSIGQDRSHNYSYDVDDDDDHILKIHPFALMDDSSSGMVVNLEHPFVAKNVYWPLSSDFVNILSQEKIALAMMENKKYFHFWLRFLTLFQGMNVNERMLAQHVEYELQAYIYAFTIELEISSAAMWCFINHLKANYPSEKLTSTIESIVNSIHAWMQSLHFQEDRMDPWKLSFNLPLHRYLSIFAHHAIFNYNINPSKFLPVHDENLMMNLLFFPLRTLAGYYEVLANIWLRNGQQLTIQAKTYAKTSFSSSMHDADLFLVQLLVSFIDPNRFLTSFLQRFHIHSWLFDRDRRTTLEPSQHLSMLENALTLLCALVAFRPNIAIRDANHTRTEIITILSISDRVYSEVEENIPDPLSLSSNRKELDAILEEVSDFQTPSVELMGHLQQGKYSIKNSIFKCEYDPLHVIMRSWKRAHFQNSLERFTNLIKHEGIFKSDSPLWPPFRIPNYDHPEISHVQRILRSRLLHELLYRCLHGYLKDKSFTENILYFTVYLLELALRAAEKNTSICSSSTPFEIDDIFTNFCASISIDGDESESFVGLLFKILQKQRPTDFYELIDRLSLEKNTNSTSFSRIGDNYHFIANVFQMASQLNEQCRHCIEHEINRIKQVQHQQKQVVVTKTSELSVEQKRQRAKNRQQKLLAEIAQSQKRFISQQNPNENLMMIGTPPSLSAENEGFDQAMAIGASPVPVEQFTDYECCVCRTSKTDSESPIGLIGTSCLSLLPSLEVAPLNEYQQKILSSASSSITLEEYLNQTKRNLVQISGHPYIANYCQNDHHLRSLLIQSCGHSIHADCLSSYLKALHPNQERAEASNTHILPSNTNFRCPLCRQSANTLIPLFDSKDYSTNQDRCFHLTPFEQLHQSMVHPSRPKLKRSADDSCLMAFLSGLAAKCVSNERLSPDHPITLPNHQSMKQRAAEFDCGTLRAQLVHEQMFYESSDKIDQKTIRKSCYKILHDLHHLGYPFHHQRLWEELTGCSCPSTIADVFHPQQPLAAVLLRDSITMLLQLLMSALNHLSSDQFDIVVQLTFNVEFLKNLLSIAIERSIDTNELMNINMNLNPLITFIDEINRIEDSTDRRPMDGSLRMLLMKNSLEFLKICSLIKSRLYSKEMPWIAGEEPSPLALAHFLNLNQNLNGFAMPRWFCDEPLVLLQRWIDEFRIAFHHHRSATKVLSAERPHFHPPFFINLPTKYDDVFHQYNEYRCEFCNNTSSDTLLCLICGEVHVKRWFPPCCNQQRQRYIQHLAKCAHPAAMMLDIQATLIAVCLPDNYGYWHSLYLDQHGEEDPKLKRGKSLYLNVQRLGVLRTLWLTATYDYQVQNWFSYNSLMISHFDVLL